MQPILQPVQSVQPQPLPFKPAPRPLNLQPAPRPQLQLQPAPRPQLQLQPAPIAAPGAGVGAAFKSAPLATAALLAGGFVLGTQVGNAIYSAIDPDSPNFNDLLRGYLGLSSSAENPTRDGPAIDYPVQTIGPPPFTGGQSPVPYQARYCNDNGCDFLRPAGVGPLRYVGLEGANAGGPNDNPFFSAVVYDSTGTRYQQGTARNNPPFPGSRVEIFRTDGLPDTGGDPPGQPIITQTPKGALVPNPSRFSAPAPSPNPLASPKGLGAAPTIPALSPATAPALSPALSPATAPALSPATAPALSPATAPALSPATAPPLLMPAPEPQVKVSPAPQDRKVGGPLSPQPTKTRRCDPCIVEVETKLDRGFKDLLKKLEDLLEDDCCQDILSRLAGEGSGFIDLAGCNAETSDPQLWGGVGLAGLYQAMQVHTQAIQQLWEKVRCIPNEFPEPILALSDIYGLSPGGDRPVLVIAYKERRGTKWAQSTYATSIHWPKPEVITEFFDEEQNPLPREHGPSFANLTLIDGSKLMAYGFSQIAALNQLSYLVGLVQTDKIPSNWLDRVVKGDSNRLKRTLSLMPRKIEYYSKGQSANVKPDNARYIDPAT